MDKEEILRDVEIIKEVFQKTNIYFSNYYPWYMLWGALIVLATSVHQYFLLSEISTLRISLIWIIFAVVGAAGSAIIGKLIGKKENKRDFTSMGRIQLLLWGATTLAIILTVLLSVVWGVYGEEYIVVFILLITGVTLVSFGVFLYKPSLYLGFLCFPVAIAMLYFPVWQPVLFGMLIGGGYFVIGTLDYFQNKRDVYGRE